MKCSNELFKIILKTINIVLTYPEVMFLLVSMMFMFPASMVVAEVMLVSSLPESEPGAR